MLLPIGHDSGTVRRQPWVTYSLMAACLLVFLYTDGSQKDLAAEHGRRTLEALRYLGERPYLEPPADLELELGPEWQEQRRVLLEMLALAGRTAHPPDQRAREQAELAELAAAVGRARDEHPFVRHGFVPSAPTLEGALGHLFLHAGWLHLLGNLLLLFLTGPFVEDRWGRPLFAIFYLASGLAAAGLFASRFPELATPLVGASGAVAGCMGAFLVRFFRARLRYLLWVGVWAFTFWAPAWLMLPLWLVSEFLKAAASDGVAGGGGVAYWAHVGGFVFGAGAAGLARALRVEERWIDAAVEKKIGGVSNAGVEAALDAHAQGRSELAFTRLLSEVRRDPGNREATQALWDVGVALGLAAEAAPALLRTIREELRRGETALAVQRWADLVRAAPDLPLDPALAARLAPALVLAALPDIARDTLRRALETRDLAPPLALRLARAAGPLAPELAARGARRVLEAPGASPEERLEARSLLEGPRDGRDTEVDLAPPDRAISLADLDLPLDSDPAAARAALEECETAVDLERSPGEDLVPGDALFDEGPEPAPTLGMLRRLRVLDAVPVQVGETALSLEVEGVGKTRLPLDRVDALAVAAVRETGAARPFLVIDLALTWSAGRERSLQVVRLRADRFDARRLLPDAPTPLLALRGLVALLLERSGARALPDPESARGEPQFATFEGLAAYEREVWSAQAVAGSSSPGWLTR